MKIHCFGNEFWKDDAFAKKIVDEIKIKESIKGIEFIKCDSVDDISDEKNIILMDVVKGIDKVIVIEDVSELNTGEVDKLKKFNCVSCHDIDLGFYLKLKKEMGEVERIKIIGIPMKGDVEKIKEEVVGIIKSDIM